MDSLEMPHNTVVIGAGGMLGSMVVASLERTGVNVISADLAGAGFRVDIRCRDEVREFMLGEVPTEAHGAVGLVVAAGLAVFSDSSERLPQEFSDVFETNVAGSIWALNAFEELCKRDQVLGSAVLVSSIYGHFVPDFSIYEHLPRKGSEVYGASKAALEYLIRYYAVRGGEAGIRVNAVAPGGIQDTAEHSDEFRDAYSRRTAQRRMVMRSEVVTAIEFLLSNWASGITGQVLAVDAGFGL